MKGENCPHSRGNVGNYNYSVHDVGKYSHPMENLDFKVQVLLRTLTLRETNIAPQNGGFQ